MFESDDWDLDQDFLNDVDDKTIKYYSQNYNQENEPKRRKIEINNDPILSFDCDVDSWEENNTNKTVTKQNDNKKSRKNLILGIFNKNLPDKNTSTDALSEPKRSGDNISPDTNVKRIQSCENNQLPRKNLVLEILKNKNKQNEIVENNTKNLELKKVVPKVKNDGNINEKLVNPIIPNDKANCQISKSNSKAESSSSNNNSKQHLNSQKELLYNVLKEQFVDTIKSKNDSIKNNLYAIKPPQIQSNKKMALVRKFPGPAGLLPDDLDSNLPCVSYLNSLEENEEASKETDSNDLSEYCSQNTKNLFTEGAWQLMLNDLPGDFLKGHDISTVKQTATLNGFNSTKIKFLAGIIEHIDYSHDNPLVVLKDFTDKVQGIVHKDIPLKYPGLLESNVVILLHDVGLLRTSGTFVSNQYQILISPSSLLAIYTCKGTVVRTQYMEEVFENISGERTKIKEKEKVKCMFTTTPEAHSSKADFQFNVKNNSNNKDLINPKSNVKSTNLNKADRNIDESMDFDTDIFSVSPTKITDSQNQKNFNCSTSKNLKYIKQENKKQRDPKQSLLKEEENIQNDDKERAKNLLKGLKRFASDANEKKQFSYHSKALQTSANDSVSVNNCFKEVRSETLNCMFSEKMNVDEHSEETKSREETVSPSYHKETERTSIRPTLLQFKSADAPVPLENVASTSMSHLEENHEKVLKKKSPDTSSSMHNILGDAEHDSDDEMLSQLDMDIIFSNYNNKS